MSTIIILMPSSNGAWQNAIMKVFTMDGCTQTLTALLLTFKFRIIYKSVIICFEHQPFTLFVCVHVWCISYYSPAYEI